MYYLQDTPKSVSHNFSNHACLDIHEDVAKMRQFPKVRLWRILVEYQFKMREACVIEFRCNSHTYITEHVTSVVLKVRAIFNRIRSGISHGSKS